MANQNLQQNQQLPNQQPIPQRVPVQNIANQQALQQQSAPIPASAVQTQVQQNVRPEVAQALQENPFQRDNRVNQQQLQNGLPADQLPRKSISERLFGNVNTNNANESARFVLIAAIIGIIIYFITIFAL